MAKVEARNTSVGDEIIYRNEKHVVRKIFTSIGNRTKVFLVNEQGFYFYIKGTEKVEILRTKD